MDYKLLEQWLAEIMPKEGKALTHQLVECAIENPHLQFLVGMRFVYPALQSPNEEVNAAAINALITGICLSQAWKHQSQSIETNLKEFLSHQSKTRGENVLDFFQEKAKLK